MTRPKPTTKPHAVPENADLAGALTQGRDPAPWLVADATTPADLDLARDVLALVIDACESGDREILERLTDVRDALTGRADTKLEREARYVQTIVELASYRSPRSGEILLPSISIPVLLSGHDRAFEKLDDAFVRKTLSNASPRGGRGKTGHLHAAAMLAVRCNAFGLGRRTACGEREIERRALDRAIAELKKARSSAKR